MGENWLCSLHERAEYGSAQLVATLAAQAADVDALFEGRTALWRAVHARKFDTVEVLLAAGADPSLPMMSGWSPARLSLTTTHPLATDEVLTAQERAAVEERDRLVAVLGDFPDDDGFSLAAVAGIDAETAARRLGAEPVELGADQVEDWWEEPIEDEGVVGVTTVPGGCLLVQPWGFDAADVGVLDRLSAGTVAYGMYANPKSGNQGSVHRDGEGVAWDLHPGGGVDEEESASDVLLAHLHLDEAVAFCCAYAGLRLADNRAFTAPDLWLNLS